MEKSIISCLLTILCLYIEEGIGERLSVSQTLVEASWQSSSYRDSDGEHCFHQTVNRSGEWNYFHTAQSPDSAGYQWLLIKLKRAVQVSSVIVHTKSNVIFRANNTDVLLSGKLPDGLSSTSGGCTSDVTPDISSFSVCGKAIIKQSGLFTLSLNEVKCRNLDCQDLTQYVLLRKYVGDQTEKYLSFKALEIHGSPDQLQLLSCKSDDGIETCKVGTKCLKIDELITVKVKPLCIIDVRILQCSIRTRRNGTYTHGATLNEKDGFYAFEFKVEAWLQGSKLECIFPCEHGGNRNLSEIIRIFANSSWTATQQIVVKEGELLSVAVTSVGNKPVPSHQCWLFSTDGQKVTMTGTKEQHGTQLVTSFSVTSTRQMNRGIVTCEVFQKGQPDSDFSQDVAVLFSSTTTSWSGKFINGSELLLTLITDEGNPKPYLECALRSDEVKIPKLTLFKDSAVRGSNGGWSSRFRLTQRFMEPQTEATVTCQIKQSDSTSALLFEPAINVKKFLRGWYTFSATKETDKICSNSNSTLLICLAVTVLIGVTILVAAVTLVVVRKSKRIAFGQLGTDDVPLAVQPEITCYSNTGYSEER